MKYDIYAGMSGGFGGANFIKTIDAKTAEEADKYAYDEAWEEYESYAGCHGILSWDEVYDELKEAGELVGMTDNEIDDFVNDHYQEEVESWIEWYAEPHKKENGVYGYL